MVEKGKTSDRTDRAICRAVFGTPQERRIGSKQLSAALGLDVHPRTVRRRLSENGLNGCIAARNPLLRPRNVIKRLKGVEERVNWTEPDWEKVLWSDESPFV